VSGGAVCSDGVLRRTGWLRRHKVRRHKVRRHKVRRHKVRRPKVMCRILKRI